MHRYFYRLAAGREPGEHHDTLTGVVESHHPLTETEIRGQAIDQTAAEYITFGALNVEEKP